MRLGNIFFLVIILLCGIETARMWMTAPAQMAAHFDAQGIPNRFAPKEQLFAFQIQLELMMVGLGTLLQILLRAVPANLMNIPNRAYWLAPERRKETVERVSSFSGILFGFILLTVQAAFEITIAANLQTPIVFNAPLMLFFIAGDFFAILILLAWLMWSFRIPSSE